MIRRLTIILIMICMMLNTAEGVFAEETLIEDESSSGETGVQEASYRIWQGYSDGTSYTILLNSDSQTASAAATQPDGTVSIISGSSSIDGAGTLMIMAEDGTSESITAEYVSSCQSSAVWNGTGITLVEAAPLAADNINEYAWYAGLSLEGDAYTFGLSLDCSQLIFAFYTPGDETLYTTEFSVSVTASGNSTIVAAVSDQDGNTYDFTYEMIGENPLHAVFTLNGEFCEAYAVEARLFDTYIEEAA